MKRFLIVVTLLAALHAAAAQNNYSFQFALVADTHVGSNGADTDLRNTVSDINDNDSLAFVIIAGDVTEFGSDDELLQAKEILGRLNKPWYIIPGNHDTKWSESGANSFRRIFGSEVFAFNHDGYFFIGTNSGPNMRMGPGQIPRENIVWLDSLLDVPRNSAMKIISVNHYPLDNSLNNWYELTDRLRGHDVRLALCGHGHANRVMTFEGIPALMGRSNLRAGQGTAGYNIIHISGDTLLTAAVRQSGVTTTAPWATMRLARHDYKADTAVYPRPDYSMNARYDKVREVWRVEQKSDIGAGLTPAGKILIVTGNDGLIRALDIRTGSQLWQYATGAKIYSTPATDGRYVVAAATDGVICALGLRSGRLLWSFDSGQPVVASPVIQDNRVFMAGSSGRCYALRLADGTPIWCNTLIKGFVETIPLIYKEMLIFGTWDNHLYALDTETGDIRWDWHSGYTNRMLSPAACVPVAVNNRVFVVAPDRKMTCLDAMTGKLIWRSDLGGSSVRESMGISADSTLILAKAMNGDIIGVKADGDSPEASITWKADVNTGYDIAPGVIKESHGVIFVPTDKGIIYAVARDDGRLLWSHRIAACLINSIVPLSSNTLVCNSMDGVVTKIRF
jgi:outer membrane protein assembly factor BamB/predicted MPP superfamily phosphohydrolase